MILVDSNLPMYLVGGVHPNKTESQRLLETLVSDGERLVTDVETLQEILHRYVSIDRRQFIQPAFDALLGVVDEVLAVEFEDVQTAKTIVLGSGQLSARDALHLAVMVRHGITTVASFDRGFDSHPGVRRIP